jgi:hypothetical protein
MGNNNYKDDGPVYFVNAELKTSKAGRKYVWSKTFDLEAIKSKLGTSVVSVTITTKKNPKTPEERLLIFKPSEAKYIPRSTGSEDSGYSNNSGSSDDDVVL